MAGLCSPPSRSRSPSRRVRSFPVTPRVTLRPDERAQHWLLGVSASDRSGLLYAISRATVPKITVIVRKAYGAGYYVMNGSGYEPDQIYAWPSAEISVMGAEGAVNIIGRSAIEASDDPEATREAMLEAIRKEIDVYIAAGNAMIDDVIDPRETRPTIIRALEMAAGKRVQRPWKRHGIVPV